MKKRRLIIIGKGKWGGALGATAKTAGFDVGYIRRQDTEPQWRMKLEGQPLVLIATPFSQVASLLEKLRSFTKLRGVINASKGIDRKSLFTFSQIAEKELKVPYATLSGPSFASELKQKKPTAVVLAGKKRSFVRKLCGELSTPYFRVYAHYDPIGVELCGATKNILAIATGITDGMKLGLNARAALLSRALVEMTKLVKALGGQSSSVLGLAGVGDLWLTATGKLSRNRRLGLLLAEGKSSLAASKKIGETVEGLYTVIQIERIRRRYKLELPICEQVYKVCVKNKDPLEALTELMTRQIKTEESSNWKLS